MRPWEIIQKLESDNSRLFKESVVADNIISEEFTVGLQYAPIPRHCDIWCSASSK